MGVSVGINGTVCMGVAVCIVCLHGCVCGHKCGATVQAWAVPVCSCDMCGSLCICV